MGPRSGIIFRLNRTPGRPTDRPADHIDLKTRLLSNRWSDLIQILNLDLVHQSNVSKHLNEDDLQWKTNYNGRRPQNIKS